MSNSKTSKSSFNPKLYRRLVDLLAPLLTSEKDRQRYIDCWCISYPKLYQKIDWTGPADAFTVQIISLFQRHGSLPSGKTGLDYLLENVYDDVGLEGQAEIESLRQILGADPADKPQQILPLVPKLFGRDQLLAQLITDVMTEPRVALQGMGGVGKTALAQALAHEPAIAHAFPDGQLWLGVGPDADLFNLLGTALHGLGYPGDGQADLASRAAALAQHLRDKRLLLILDDLWTMDHATPFLNGCTGGVHLLVTLRQPQLADDLAAHLVEVPMLELEPAVEMLRAGGGPARQAIDREPDAAHALAQCVDNLPLGLHVVGRRLNQRARAKFRQPVSTLVQSLTSRTQEILKLPALHKRPGLAADNPSLDAVLALSYEQLPSDKDRRAFAQLSVFGPQPLNFDRAALNAVWQLDDDLSDLHLFTLMDQGLLIAQEESAEITGGETRYSLHQLQAIYASSELAKEPSLERATHLAHARYYAQIMACYDDWIQAGQMAFREPVEWDQVTEAIAWLVAQRVVDGEDAEIGAVLLDYAQHWRNVLYNNHHPHQDHWLHHAVETARQLGTFGQLVNALTMQGDVLAFLDHRDEAWKRYDEVLGLFRNVNNRLGEANMLMAEGNVLAFLDERHKALTCYQKALDLYRNEDARLGEANVLMAQGDVLASLGERYGALKRYEDALDLFRNVGDRVGEANVLLGQGDVLASLCRRDEALKCYYEALVLFRNVGDRVGEANVLEAQGNFYLDNADETTGLALLEEARTLYHQIGDQAGLANISINLADHAAGHNQYAAAIAYMQPALDFVRAIGHPVAEDLQAILDGWQQALDEGQSTA